MALAHITNLTSIFAARVLAQYKPLPRMMALLGGLTDAAQEIEDALWNVVLQFQISTAQGAWLDLIGKFVGQGREGLGDIDYRGMIRARIIANASNGAIQELLNAINACYGLTPGNGFTLLEWNFCAVTILIPPGVEQPLETDLVLKALLKVMRGVKSAGTKLTIQYLASDFPDAFVYDDATSPGHVTGMGWGDATSPLTAAGKWAGANDA